jgi:hypothetical protein
MSKLIKDMTPNEMIKIITIGLGEPPGIPLACTRILVSCYYRLGSLWGSCTRAQRHAICAQAMRFLAAPRTSEDMVVLKDTLQYGICRCESGPAILRRVAWAEHELEDPNLDFKTNVKNMTCINELALAMMHLLSRELRLCTRLCSAHEIRGQQSRPTCMEELLPGGPVLAIPRLAYWIDVVLSGWRDVEPGIAFIMPILRIVGSPATIVWMMTANMWRLAKSVISQCERSHPSAGVRQSFRQEFVLFSRFLRIVEDILFDEELHTVIQQHPTFTSHEITDIINKGLRIASELEAEDPVACIRLQDGWKHVLYHCAMHSPIAPAAGLIEQTSDALTDMEANDEASETLCNLIFCSAWAHRCSGPSCLNVYSSSGAAFKVCGGCWVSKYCSRQCQKRGWSHPQAAHRDTCGVYVGYTYGWRDAEEQMRSTDSFRNACANVEALKATHISELSEFLMPRIFCCVVIADIEQESS